MDEQVVPQQPFIVEQPLPENIEEGNPKRKRIIILAISVLIVLFLTTILLFFFFYKPLEEVSSPAKRIEITPTQVIENYEMTLVINEPQNIPNSDKQIELIELDVPGDNCFDCISSIGISIIDELDRVDFYYSCGGLTGECEVKKEAKGYSFEILETVNSDSIRINIIKI